MTDVNLYAQQELFEFVEKLALEIKHGRTSFDDLGDVNVRENGNLLLFKYSRATQYAATWTKMEQASRGLIISKSGDLVAVPWFKFFNWNQYGLRSTGNIVHVTEKLDGSLGIVYNYNGWSVATGGSFESTQAQWATEKLADYNLHNIHEDDNLTLMVEIIFDANRLEGPVMQYDFEGLVLIGARDNITGKLLPRYEAGGLLDLSVSTGIPLVKAVSAHSILSLIEQTGSVFDEEGWVGYFSDDTVFKFKTDWYFEQQRLVGGFSFKRIAEMWAEGRREIHTLPDEFYQEAEGMLEDLDGRFDDILQEAKDLGKYLSNNFSERKDMAIELFQIASSKGVASIVFSILDGHDVDTRIRKLVLKNL